MQSAHLDHLQLYRIGPRYHVTKILTLTDEMTVTPPPNIKSPPKLPPALGCAVQNSVPSGFCVRKTENVNALSPMRRITWTVIRTAVTPSGQIHYSRKRAPRRRSPTSTSRSSMEEKKISRLYFVGAEETRRACTELTLRIQTVP